MCVNYEPIRLTNIPKLGMHQPAFDFAPEAWPDYQCPIIIHGDEKRSPIVIPPEYRKDWLNADHRTASELLHEIDASQFTASPFPVPPRKPKSSSLPKITKNNSDSKSTNLDLF